MIGTKFASVNKSVHVTNGAPYLHVERYSRTLLTVPDGKFRSQKERHPDRAPLKEVLGGQYNYREGGRQVLRQGAKGRRRNRKWQCSKDPCAQKVSGGRTDPSPKYRWKVHG